MSIRRFIFHCLPHFEHRFHLFSNWIVRPHCSIKVERIGIIAKYSVLEYLSLGALEQCSLIHKITEARRISLKNPFPGNHKKRCTAENITLNWKRGKR